VLEEGILFETFQGFANKALFPSLETKLIPDVARYMMSPLSIGCILGCAGPFCMGVS
jgi:hypothetical protein